jgi:hypothetical protein
VGELTLPATVAPYAEFDARMVGDLRGYCAALVQIQNKAGQLVPFVWREAQVQLHAKLERQREARGPSCSLMEETDDVANYEVVEPVASAVSGL